MLPQPFTVPTVFQTLPVRLSGSFTFKNLYLVQVAILIHISLCASFDKPEIKKYNLCLFVRYIEHPINYALSLRGIPNILKIITCNPYW